MSKTLILMRHAKSSWKDTALPDHDRPLNARGRASATAMGGWLRDNGWVPDQALVSTSVRTRETWAGLGFDVTADFHADLYHPFPDEMLDVLMTATGDTVLALAHNPGMACLAPDLCATQPDHARFEDFPTCATLVLRFEIDSWSDLQRRTGIPLGFAIPREIIDAS